MPDQPQVDLRELVDHYDRLAREHGYSPEAVHWSSWETAERRFEVLLEGFPKIESTRILDFGCGAGHLLRYLKTRGFTGEYVGYDISPEMIRLARESNPGGQFELRNLLEEPPGEEFDLALVSGVFNNALADNKQFMEAALKVLYRSVKIGVAFNALSRYVHFRSDGLHYYCPMRVFEYCKSQLTPRVSIRHDYQLKPGIIPFEFTVYLYKSEIEPVAAP